MIVMLGEHAAAAQAPSSTRDVLSPLDAAEERQFSTGRRL
jgi:hypothetical protein